MEFHYFALTQEVDGEMQLHGVDKNKGSCYAVDILSDTTNLDNLYNSLSRSCQAGRSLCAGQEGRHQNHQPGKTQRIGFNEGTCISYCVANVFMCGGAHV